MIPTSQIIFQMYSCCAVYVGRTSLSRGQDGPHQYAEAVHLYELLGEATRILLRKVGVGSQQVVPELMQQCNRGEHVLLKSYGSFSKSILSKLCFLHNFLKIFQVQTPARNGLDYYQLSRLLCSDFPREFVQRAAAMLLPQVDATSQMYQPLPTKRFAQALYMQMIFTEYLEALQAHFAQEDALDFLGLLRLLRQQDANTPAELAKPPFSVPAQAILNLMRRKGLLQNQQSPVVFLTEDTLEDFVKEAASSQTGQTVGLNELLQEILDSGEYAELVEENLGMFENSHVWATENYKILSSKEPTEAPLNVKKKGGKK